MAISQASSRAGAMTSSHYPVPKSFIAAFLASRRLLPSMPPASSVSEGLRANELPSLPSVPAPILWFAGICTTIGLLLTVLLYFAIFPPSVDFVRLPIIKHVLELKRKVWPRNGGYVDLSTTDESDSEIDYESHREHGNRVKTYASGLSRPNTGLSSCSSSSTSIGSRSKSSSNSNCTSEFEWLLNRAALDDGMFDMESQTRVLTPESGRKMRHRLRGSSMSPPHSAGVAFADSVRTLSRPVVATFRSLPNTPSWASLSSYHRGGPGPAASRRRSSANIDGKPEEIQPSNKNIFQEGFLARCGEAVDEFTMWAARKHSLGDEDEDLLLPIASPDRERAVSNEL